MKKLLLCLAACGLILPALAQGTAKSLLNLDKDGVAIQGFDPVAFFTDHKPVKGSDAFVRRYNGAVYFFASKEHLDLFKADPAKYEPAFGGYCAYGVSRKKLVEIDVDAFQIVDGRLLLQYSKGVRDDFNEDQKGNLAKAEQNWPALVEKKGK
jgi:YHS domain-containing protein